MKPLQIRTLLDDVYQDLDLVQHTIEDSKYSQGNLKEDLKEIISELYTVINKLDYLGKQI